MSGFVFKRGDTLRLTADISDDAGAPVSLVDATITCELRDASNGLVATLTAVPDPVTVGRVVLTGPSDTSQWPLSTLRSDLACSWADGTRTHSETFTVTVQASVT